MRLGKTISLLFVRFTCSKWLYSWFGCASRADITASVRSVYGTITDVARSLYETWAEHTIKTTLRRPELISVTKDAPPA